MTKNLFVQYRSKVKMDFIHSNVKNEFLHCTVKNESIVSVRLI